MTGIRSGKLAAELLKHADNSAVVDILLPRADMDNEIKLKAAPSASIASKYNKGKLNHAITVAAYKGTDPQVLAKYAKDTRVSVRRALIENPSTPYDSILELASWARSKGDSHELRAISRLKAADIVKVLSAPAAENRHIGDYDSYKLMAKTLISSNDGELIKEAFALKGETALKQYLASNIYAHINPPVSLTEALSALQGRELVLVLTEVADSTEHCSLELAQLLASLPGEAYVTPRSFLILADGAAEALLKSNNLGVCRSAIMSGAKGEVLDNLLDRLPAKNYFAVIEDVKNKLTKKQVASMLNSLVQEAAENFSYQLASSAVSLLSNSKYKVPSALMLESLKNIGGDFTSHWLNGHLGVNTPRNGEITKLVEAPGYAFYTGVRYYYGKAANTPRGQENKSNILINCMGAALGSSWAQEYANAMGGELLPNIRRSPNSSAWLLKQMYAAFGTHEGCWETVLTLSNDWNGAVDELISTTLILNDVEPVVLEEQPVSLQEQLEL